MQRKKNNFLIVTVLLQNTKTIDLNRQGMVYYICILYGYSIPFNVEKYYINKK